MEGWAWVLTWIASVALVAFVSFRIGKRLGTRQGTECAARAMPLELRKKTLATGVCPVCDTKHPSWYNVRKEVVE